jgi:hypothetical protein
MVTWNPADKDATITLSNNDLTATGTGNGIVRANTDVSAVSGVKWYFEVTVGDIGSSIHIGIANVSETYFLGSSANGWSYENNGDKNNGSSSSFGDSYTTGDVIGICGSGLGKIWFAKNNVWQNGGDPENSTNEAFNTVSGTVYPSVSLTNGLSVIGNFNKYTQTYAPPSGYIPLDIDILLNEHEFQAAKLNFNSILDPPFQYPRSVISSASSIPIPDNAIRPKAYVMFMDYESFPSYERKEWHLLATAQSFNVSNAKNNPLGSFNVSIAEGDIWNTRTSTYENILEPHLQKVVRIYYSQDGGVNYTMLFEGQPNTKPESYSYGGQNLISISGVSLASRMQRSFFDPQEGFSGTTKELMNGYTFKTMSDTSGGYILNFGDGYTHTDIDVGYTTALQAVQDLLKILGPGYSVFMDYENDKATLIVGVRPSSTVFEYNDSNTISLNVNSAMGIITKCEVIGFDDTAIYTADASADEVLKHGENLLNISNGLITTLADATILATSYITVAGENQKTWDINCVLNPLIQIGHTVKISSEKSTLYTDGGEFITDYQHSYQVGSVPTTSMKGIYSKLV